MVLMPIWMKNPAWNAGLNMVVAHSTSLRAGKQKSCGANFLGTDFRSGLFALLRVSTALEMTNLRTK